MRKRGIYIIKIMLIAITANSCGVFLKNAGMKNYSLDEKIDKREFNDYQYDFVYLTHLLEQGFPNINSVFPAKEREIQRKQIIASLSSKNINNNEFVLYTRKYLSNFHNQHTNIYLKSDIESIYPYSVHISYDKWYLFNIDEGQDSLNIGKKIDKINGVEINEIEKRLFDYTFAENKINQQYELRHFQFSNRPSYLKAINVIKDPTEKIKITFSDSSQLLLETTKDYKNLKWHQVNGSSNEITKWENKTYFYKIYPNQDFGYLQFNTCHDKIDILESLESYVKPWLVPIAKRYVKRQFKKENPSKQLAPYYNTEYPVFKDFIWELIDSLNNNNINNLVIDLRNNPGGNLSLGIQLMYFLTDKKNVKGFTEYIYTSSISKNYFKSIYEDLGDKYSEDTPNGQLLLTEDGDDLFNEITDSTSVYYIPQSRPIYKGRVFILSNYRTGSAAAMLTTLCQDNAIGTIIGTSVGNNPTGATIYTPMKLPKTKANISIATYYQERPNKLSGKIQFPDYWVEYSMNDFITDRDPYLEKVKELMSE